MLTYIKIYIGLARLNTGVKEALQQISDFNKSISEAANKMLLKEVKISNTSKNNSK